MDGGRDGPDETNRRPNIDAVEWMDHEMAQIREVVEQEMPGIEQKWWDERGRAWMAAVLRIARPELGNEESIRNPVVE